MKTKLYIIAILSVMSIAGYAVSYSPMQGMQSTSSMRTSGSVYTPQVTEVGAAYAASEATTTESYSPNKAPSGPKRDKILGPDTDPANESPIGDAVLPMLLCAAVFCGVIMLRRKRSALKS